jgi:ribosomal protein L7/L12
MNLSRKLLAGAAMSALLLGGCTSKVTDQQQYSGYLSNYSNLQEVSTPSGGTAMRWVSPSWNANAYDTVAFNKLELYPAPQPNERVNQQTLDDLQNYMTTKAKGVLGQKYRIVSSPAAAPAGSKTLILRAAITGVNASNEGMKWYEVVPVAAVVGAAQAASGHRDQDTNLFIEAELIDANTNQTVVKVVRKVFGTQLSNASQQITTNDFKAAIDKLNADIWAFIRS